MQDISKERENTVGRRQETLRLLSEKGSVFVEELSQRFKVSQVTIRNDLEQLEGKNALIRVRGGAIKFETGVAIDQRLADKSRINFAEKSRIGKAAAQRVKEADTIIIDSGSTTSELVRNLPDLQNLTVLTNALNIANQLVANTNINLIMPGGYLRKNSLSLVGPLAEKSLRNFNADKVFLGVDGFDTRLGIFTPNIEESRLNEIMIEISKEVIILVDSSKFKKRSLALICPISRIHTVITDTNISPDDRKRLQDGGIEVIVV
jgi:DeoR family transcriptional regulator of aga operon